MFLQNELLTRLLDELVADDSSGGFRDCRSYLGEAVRMHLPDRRNQITANCFSQLQRVVAFREVPIVPEHPGDVNQVCVVDRRRALKINRIDFRWQLNRVDFRWQLNRVDLRY